MVWLNSFTIQTRSDDDFHTNHMEMLLENLWILRPNVAATKLSFLYVEGFLLQLVIYIKCILIVFKSFEICLPVIF